MKRFLLGLVITSMVGSSVLAGDDRTADTFSDALAAKPPRPAAPRGRQAAPQGRFGAPRARAAPQARQVTPRARQATPTARRAGAANPRAGQAWNAAPGARRTQLRPNARPGPPGAPNVRPRLAANPNRQVPDWGRVGRNFRAQDGPNLGWHVRRPNGIVIARNYPSWSRNWWSPRWGVWFRYDPTTSGYYYFEPSVGYYVQTETITTYRQPLERPISDPTTDPDDIPVTDPPDPVEP
jgi:hypothetical protein